MEADGSGLLWGFKFDLAFKKFGPNFNTVQIETEWCKWLNLQKIIILDHFSTTDRWNNHLKLKVVCIAIVFTGKMYM